MVVSEITEKLWAEYEDFCKRDLAEHDIVYLFVDGIAERLRPGQRREGGARRLGGRRGWTQIAAGADGGLQGGRRDGSRSFRICAPVGLGDPLLVASDGAPGIIRAIEECFPRSARQRCLAHRMRNLAAKVPADPWPEFKAGLQPGIRRRRGRLPANWRAGIRADDADLLPSALACFEDDFEACVAHLRLPVPIAASFARRTASNGCSSRSAEG